jgi:hypothetical protein
LSLRVKTSWLRCLCPGLFAVHYVGRLATNGEVFMDARKESTANEPVTIVAGRGRSYRKPTIELSWIGRPELFHLIGCYEGIE